MPADARMVNSEVVSRTEYPQKMRRLGARQSDKRSRRGSLFWAPSSKRWIIAYSGRGGVVLEYYVDCPCGS